MTHGERIAEDNQPKEVPLVELLESVPETCREMIEVGPCHHRNIPYGRFCHDAAKEIKRLNEVLAALEKDKELFQQEARQRSRDLERVEAEASRLRLTITKLQKGLDAMRGQDSQRARIYDLEQTLVKLRAEIAPLAAQFIHPTDNTLSRQLALIDAALAPTKTEG